MNKVIDKKNSVSPVSFNICNVLEVELNVVRLINVMIYSHEGNCTPHNKFLRV